MPIRPTKRSRRVFVALALAGAWVAAMPLQAAERAAPEPQSNGFWSIQFENDVWGSGDDRFYSHGTEISYLSLERPPRWLTRIARKLPFFELGEVNALQYSLGQKIFTPQDTETTELIEEDRPYAGWLYVNAELLSRIEEGPNHRIGNLFGLSLGMVGPSSYAEEVQKKFHELIGVDLPQGWDNQLHDEPGVMLTYTRKWQRFHDLPIGLEFETSPHVVGALGNVYTYAGGGIMFRFGKGLRNDFSPPNIRPGFPGIAYLRPTTEPNWYFFAGIEARGVARNIFLDGNSFRDSHSVDKEPLVADVQFGFAFHVNQFRIAASNVWRSPEFEGQPERTRFGAINLSFSLPF